MYILWIWWIAVSIATETGCFDSWVPGWGTSDYEYLVGKKPPHDREVTSAEECQGSCQETKECDFFLFDTIGHSCFLRTYDEVILSAGVELPPLDELPGGKDERWLYCDMRITALCGDSLTCKQCDGTTRCVWYEERLLFGPKFCTDGADIDLCNMEYKVVGNSDTGVTEGETEVWAAGIGVAAVVLLGIPVSYGIYSYTKKSCIQSDSFSIGEKRVEMTEGIDFVDPFV